MTQNSNHQFLPQSPQTAAELDLLKSLVETDSPYLWDPTQPEAEAFFTQLEQTWGEAEASAGVGYEAFSQKLTQLWGDDVASSAGSSIQASLQNFASRAPQKILAAIAQQAQAVVDTNLSLSDQLVQCVQDLFPEWGAEDLTVLARPLAYAMRDAQGDMLETTLAAVPEKDWETLAPVEQARLSLAIARYAVDQAHDQVD